MTNTENASNTPADINLEVTVTEPVNDYFEDEQGCTGCGPEDNCTLSVGPVFTAATLDGHYDRPEGAYRYLTWVHKTASRMFDVQLGAYSVERQEGVNDLVRNGLVSEAHWQSTGRTTYRLTELGTERLAQARDAAALVVVG